MLIIVIQYPLNLERLIPSTGVSTALQQLIKKITHFQQTVRTPIFLLSLGTPHHLSTVSGITHLSIVCGNTHLSRILLSLGAFYCLREHHISIVSGNTIFLLWGPSILSGNTIFLFIVSGNTNFLFIVSGITHLSISGNTIFLLSLGSPIFLLSVPPIFLEFNCLWGPSIVSGNTIFLLWGPSIVSGNTIFLLSPGTPSFYCLWEHHLSFYCLWDHPSFCPWEHHLFTASGNTIFLLSLGSPIFLLSLGSCRFLLSLGSRSFPGRVLRQVSHDTWTSVATSQSYQDERCD